MILDIEGHSNVVLFNSTIGTSTLSTWPSCWSTANAAPDCSSTKLSGRKRRSNSDFIEEKPKVWINNELHDFYDVIQASRVRVLLTFISKF